jgi:hypothetical protein
MRLPKILILSIVVLGLVFLAGIFAYGVSVQRYRLFPYAHIEDVEAAFEWFWDRRPGGDPWYVVSTDKTLAISGELAEEGTPGLNLVTSLGAGDTPEIKLIDMQGRTVHQWPVDWFDIWQDPDHVRFDDQPKSKPGGHIHGIAMLDDGSIVFNFENLSMVRMSKCGEVMWKLAYRTHHSIFVDEDGNIWSPAQRFHEQKLPDFANHSAPVSESMILKVSPEGEILREISMFEWFVERDMRGWLHMGGGKLSNVVVGDALHMNDVELYPSGMASELFAAGDIMISLRELNSVMVLDRDTLDIKYWKTDGIVRQHDPDFIGSDRISIFDNNHVGPKSGSQQSRIVIDHVSDQRPSEIVYTGSAEEPFYTQIMGKHQWLPNGNLLVTDSTNGRAIEINKQGEIVWEFVNLVAEGKAGLVEEVQRLPLKYSGLFKPDTCSITQQQ